MQGIAHDISQLVHAIGAMDSIAEKVASADSSAECQRASCQASFELYNVIVKEASDTSSPQPLHAQVVSFVDKIAHILGRNKLSEDARLKIAAAITTDEALQAVMQKVASAKLSSAQAYGREYLMALLREVI